MPKVFILKKYFEVKVLMSKVESRCMSSPLTPLPGRGAQAESKAFVKATPMPQMLANHGLFASSRFSLHILSLRGTKQSLYLFNHLMRLPRYVALRSQ
jgi:hypothetical protein